MEILDFIKTYWVQIVFLGSVLTTFVIFIMNLIEATKCSLRNDILDIYDRCKLQNKITHYQLESIKYSYAIYKKLKGNSFVEEIVERVKQFELVD